MYAKYSRREPVVAQDVKEKLATERTAKLPRHVRFFTRQSRKGLPAPACTVELERGIQIPMSDGTHQIADRYIPQTGAGSPTTSCTGACSPSTVTAFCCRAPGERADPAAATSRSLTKRPTPRRRSPGYASRPGSTARPPRYGRA